MYVDLRLAQSIQPMDIAKRQKLSGLPAERSIFSADPHSGSLCLPGHLALEGPPNMKDRLRPSNNQCLRYFHRCAGNPLTGWPPVGSGSGELVSGQVLTPEEPQDERWIRLVGVCCSLHHGPQIRMRNMRTCPPIKRDESWMTLERSEFRGFLQVT